jgi:hypothetical protein
MADINAQGIGSANYDAPVSNSTEIIDTLSGLEAESSKETFGCQQCSKVFNRRENLSRHLKTRMYIVSSAIFVGLQDNNQHGDNILSTVSQYSPASSIVLSRLGH